MNTAAQPARGGVVVPFVLIALIWGSTWFVIRDQISAVPPGWTTAWSGARRGDDTERFVLYLRDPS